MSALLTDSRAHPQGESQKQGISPSQAWPLDTPGGRFFAEWDEDTPTTKDGQLIFFFQFLQAGGRWQKLMENCPLHYVGNRGSGAKNVLGTVLLSILNGHWRYAHINAIRGDAINPPLLGMEKTAQRGHSEAGDETHSRGGRTRVVTRAYIRACPSVQD